MHLPSGPAVDHVVCEAHRRGTDHLDWREVAHRRHQGGVPRAECGSLLQALWVILVADLSMGIDNMLAVGAASHGNLFLLLFGLALSIPFVVFMSNLLSRWMERWPIILWIGAAVLGRVGGEMMITDPWVQGLLNPSKGIEYTVQAFFIVLVCASSKWLVRRRDAGVPAVGPVVLAGPTGQKEGA